MNIVTKIIFPTADMEASLAFYRSIGLETESFDGSYAWVTNAGAEVLHLAHIADLDPIDNRAAGYFHVQNVDEVHERWSSAVAVDEALGDRPWGMREFSIRDPSNNLIRVGQNL